MPVSTHHGVLIWYVNLLLSCGGFSENEHTPQATTISDHIQNENAPSQTWQLQEQKQIKNVSRPHWFSTDCNNEPCFSETWTFEKQTHTAYWSNNQYHWTDTILFKTRWQGLNGVLLHCLGHPYSVPIAQDPGGKRQLIGIDKWVFTLSGNNRCELNGQVIIYTNRETIDLQYLTVHGIQWHEGGRQLALKILNASSKTSSE